MQKKIEKIGGVAAISGKGEGRDPEEKCSVSTRAEQSAREMKLKEL